MGLARIQSQVHMMANDGRVVGLRLKEQWRRYVNYKYLVYDSFRNA